ncbi:ACT domain-containing protein [Sporomusa sp.]|uniref:ACT domain-containing protein n=1 Tax=Sporomusa sp. TaxID=2078658 RepID=UPI002CF11C82|nr:ACT domain-containing protein [Sporomusa sp.]HWR45056.1 ACT domain-containing protein [Sporomusa sp.]
MSVIRWMVKTTDRIGMIQDVVQVFSREGVSISSMEVSTGQIFIKFHVDTASRLEEILKRELLYHTDIIDIIDIALQPYEQGKKNCKLFWSRLTMGLSVWIMKGPSAISIPQQQACFMLSKGKQ